MHSWQKNKKTKTCEDLSFLIGHQHFFLKTKTKNKNKTPLNIAWCPHSDLNPVLTVPHNILYDASLYPRVVILHYYVMIFMSWAHHTVVWVLYVFHAIDPASVSSGPFGWGLMTEAELIPQRNTHCTLLCREKTLMRPLKECHTGVLLDVALGSPSPLSHTHTHAHTHGLPCRHMHRNERKCSLCFCVERHTFNRTHAHAQWGPLTVGATVIGTLPSGDPVQGALNNRAHSVWQRRWSVWVCVGNITSNVTGSSKPMFSHPLHPP